MTHLIDLQIVSNTSLLPSIEQFQMWVDKALSEVEDDTEITIRIVEEEEISDLNKTYRKNEGPTNILSFPYEGPQDSDYLLLGDLVICAPIVEKEATVQQKELLSHWAHMVIHGALHLLGYDHKNDQEAEHMENLETRYLSELGFPSPYGVMKII